MDVWDQNISGVLTAENIETHPFFQLSQLRSSITASKWQRQGGFEPRPSSVRSARGAT